MIKRNKKLFSLILSAVLLSSYTTTNIIPITVLATETRTKENYKNNNYSPADQLLSDYINSFPREEKSWLDLKESNSLSRYEIEFNKENFYEKIDITMEEANNKIKTTLKDKLKDKIKLIEFTDQSLSSSKLIILTTDNIDTLNKNLNEITSEILENTTNFEFKEVAIFDENSNNSSKIPDSNKTIYIKQDNSSKYINIGSKISSKNSISNQLSLKEIPTLKNFDTGIKKDEILAFFINDIQYSLEDIISSTEGDNLFLSIKLPSLNNKIDLLTKSNNDTLYDSYSYEVNFEENSDYKLNLKPSILDLTSLSEKKKLLTFKIRSNDLSIVSDKNPSQGFLFAEINYKGTTSPVIVKPKYNDTFSYYEFYHTFDSSKEIDNINLYYYNDNLNLLKENLKLPIEFSNTPLDFNDVIIEDNKEKIELNINSLNDDFTEHFIIGLNGKTNSNKKIKIEKGKVLDVDTLIELGLNKSSSKNTFKISSVYKDSTILESNYDIATHSNNFELNATNSKGDILVTDSLLKLNKENHKDNYEVNLISNHKIKDFSITIDGKSYEEVSKKDDKTISINLEPLKEIEGKSQLEITINSHKKSKTFNFELLVDNTKPVVTTLPYDKNSYKLIEDNVIVLNKDYQSLSFEIFDNLGSNDITITSRDNPNIHITYEDNPRRFVLTDIADNTQSIYNLRATDSSGNFTDFTLKVSKNLKTPEIILNIANNPQVNYLDTEEPQNIYIKKNNNDINDVITLNFNLKDIIFLDTANCIFKLNGREIKATDLTTEYLKFVFNSADLDLKSSSSNKLTLKITNLAGVSTDKNFNLILNNEEIANNSDTKTDRLKISLSSPDKTYENKDLTSFEATHRPLTSDEETTTLELTENLSGEEKLTLNFEKQFKESLKDLEKIKIEYGLTENYENTLDFDSESNNGILNLDLKRGNNFVYFKVHSSNGSFITHKLNIKYDPTPIAITFNHNGTEGQHIKPFSPELLITDENISEVSSILVDNSIDGEVDLTFEGKSLEDIKSTSDGSTTYSLNKDKITLSEGVYDKFSIAVNSTFGARRPSTKVEYPSFIIDGTAPLLEETPIGFTEKDKFEGYWALKNGQTEFQFPLSDNYSSLDNLSIDCTSDKVELVKENGNLVVKNIVANEKIDFQVTITDLAGNSVTKEIKVLKDTLSPLGELTTEDENIYFEESENESVPSNFYIPIDYNNDLKFILALEDNFKLDLDSLKVNFKNESIVTTNGNLKVEPIVSIKKLSKKKTDDHKVYFEIKLSNLEKIEAADLNISISDLFNNSKSYDFKLNRNENTIENLDSIYKTNHLTMSLKGTLENSNKIIEGDLNSLDNIYKPLIPVLADGIKYPIFEFADKFINDTFYLDIKKTIPTETAGVEKIKIYYTLNSALPEDRKKANIIDFNDTNYEPIAIKLNPGLNEFNYEVVSTNGSKINHQIVFYYDTTTPTVTVNSANENSYYNYLPSIEVKDENIDEINKLEITYKFNGVSKKTTYTDDELLALKSISNGKISYKVKFDSLPDGKYTDFKAIAFSNFGTRRNNKDMVASVNEFIIDTVGPKASVAIYNKNKSNYELLNKNSFYNTNGTDNPLLLLVEKEEFDDFNADVNINNFNININGFNTDYFNIKSSSEITINGKVYFSYLISSKDSNIINLSSEGNFNVKFNLKDDANNHSNLFISNYSVDKKAPTIDGRIRNKVTEEVVILDNITTGSDFFINGDKFYANINDKNLDSLNLNVSLTKGSSKILNTYYSKTFDLTSEGYYEVEAIAIDKAGNETKRYYKFNVDKFAPKINLDSFNNNPIYPRLPQIDLSMDGKNKNSYIIVDDSMNSTASTNIIITEKNSNSTEPGRYFNKTFTNSIADISPNLKEGKYEIVVETIDKAGNKSKSAKKDFVIDTSKPIISINSTTGDKTVENNKHYNTKKISTSITIDDVSTTSDDVLFKINGNIQKPKSSRQNNNYSTTYILNDLTKDDIYDLEVIAGDRVSREGLDSRGKSNSNLNFAIDTKAPSLNVSIGNRIIDNIIYLNNHSTNLSIKATDEISKVEKDELTITTTINQAVRDNNYRFGTDGRYNVNVVVSDKAGNKSTYTSEVEVDTVFPVIDFKGILPDHFYNKNLFPNINFDSNDKVVNSVTLNGKPFDGSKIVEEGNHTLVISSTDLAGNKTELVIKFVIDKTAPVIKVSGVENNGVYTNKVTPIITYDDLIETHLTALLNNMEYSGQDIDADGFYTLFVKGVDKAGNKTEVSFKFKVNVSAPIIELASIENGKTYDGSLKLDFKFKDAVDYKILLNGKPYNGEEITEDGAYHVKVTAIDEDKNETVQEYTFYINRNNPETTSKNEVNMAAISAGAIVVVLALLLYFKRRNKTRYSIDDEDDN